MRAGDEREARALDAHRDQRDASAATDLEGRYANYLEVGFNATEFVVDVGQHYADDVRARLHTRIVTTPRHMKRFVAMLQRCVVDYEARHGAIGEGSP